MGVQINFERPFFFIKLINSKLVLFIFNHFLQIPINSNTRIQFKTNQKNKGIYLNPKHKDDDGSDGAIQFIIGVK